MVAEVLNAIREREIFLVTSHARPDGDAIGSALGLALVLRALGKRADVVLSDPVPVIYQPLPQAKSIQQASSLSGSYQAAIILECDSLQRTGLGGLESAAGIRINIDHHASARPFADINWIDTAASATGEMIYKLARAAGVALTPEIATCLYTAVLTDTGSFCFSGTDDHVFALAEELVRAGADPVSIAQNVYFANPESKMRLLGAALSSLKRSGPLAWMFVTQAQMKQTAALEEDCEGLVNYALGIAGVEAAIFFRELPDGRFRVSLRSKGAINVARIAERFGGGGHACASGCSLAGPLPVATQQIVEQFQALQQTPVEIL